MLNGLTLAVANSWLRIEPWSYRPFVNVVGIQGCAGCISRHTEDGGLSIRENMKRIPVIFYAAWWCLMFINVNYVVFNDF